MAERDMMAIYEQEQYNVPDDYDITVDEMDILLHIGRNGKEGDALNIAFVYGFILGRRAEKNHEPKERSSDVEP